jgi:hypothetical protein
MNDNERLRAATPAIEHVDVKPTPPLINEGLIAPGLSSGLGA